MTQILLFPDSSPLVERLGRDFFRQLPERPGIYLMRGAADALLYVGKAKNLRRRLGSYRVANPDRMPRRHLRLLRAVERIEIQECADERAALEREAHLLRTLRPKFNRAGTWTGPPKFLAWKVDAAGLHFTVTETPGPEWRASGNMGAGARYLRTAVVRLAWVALWPVRGISQMPAGWFRGRYGETVTLEFSIPPEELAAKIHALFSGEADKFIDWVASRAANDLPLFEKTVLAADIEFLNETLA